VILDSNRGLFSPLVTMIGFNRLPALCLTLLCATSTIAHPQRRNVIEQTETPTVNLGYEIHQGTINVCIPSF
jgi:hypothetical protein